jgi:hypothetical protein
MNDKIDGSQEVLNARIDVYSFIYVYVHRFMNVIDKWAGLYSGKV